MLYISAFDIRPSDARPRNLSVASDTIWTERREKTMTKFIVSVPERYTIRIDLDESLGGARALWNINSIPGVSDYRLGTEKIEGSIRAHHYEMTVWHGRAFDGTLIAVRLVKLLAEHLQIPFTEVEVTHGDPNGVHAAEAIRAAQRLEGGDKKDEFAIGEGLPQ